MPGNVSDFKFYVPFKRFLSHHFYPNTNKTKERKENVVKAIENSFFWHKKIKQMCCCSVGNLLLHAGKTLLAKAVANQTSATFLRVVGSELIQKYLGDGPKLVRELFRVAEEHAPSIVFIDEIDAIGTKR